MNIDGLDYNTQREQIVLPEYGREIQQMVDYAVGLPDREERQRCARAIIAIMDRMFPERVKEIVGFLLSYMCLCLYESILRYIC